MKLYIFICMICLIGQPIHSQDQYVRSGDIELRYQVAGDGPPVILLHGWSLNLDSWDYVVPALSGDFTVIRYDRRGYGKSGGKVDTSLDPVDLKALMIHLNVEEAVIIGHSEGGASALRFALAFPERTSGLVLLGAPAPEGFGLAWDGEDALPRLDLIIREYGADSLRSNLAQHPICNGFAEHPEGEKLLNTILDGHDYQELLDPVVSANATPYPHIDRLSEIKIPVLVITGETEMPYFQIVSDMYSYAIANADRSIVPGGGHCVMMQDAEAFNQQVLQFLKSSEHSSQ